MAVLVEAISVIIRASSIHQKFFGGWEAFKLIIPNRTMCADHELVRVGFMTPDDAKEFVSLLQGMGLEFLKNNEPVDIAVADQMSGMTTECRWAEFERINLGGTKNQEVGVCRLAGSKLMRVATPPRWQFEGSLSQSFGFVSTEHVNKNMKFLRHENGIDVYLDLITGKEMFVGRTGG